MINAEREINNQIIATDSIIEFCFEVDDLAQKKMFADGKVEGKHYASICQLLKEKFGFDFEAEKKKRNQGIITGE